MSLFRIGLELNKELVWSLIKSLLSIISRNYNYIFHTIKKYIKNYIFINKLIKKSKYKKL